MLNTLKLLNNDDEISFWPSKQEVIDLLKVKIPPEFIIRRKLVNRGAKSFAPQQSFASWLRLNRDQGLVSGISNQDM